MAFGNQLRCQRSPGPNCYDATLQERIMKNTVISINSREESISVQNKLIQKGIYWASGTRYPTFTDKPFLCVDNLNSKNKTISFRERLPFNFECSDLHKHKIIRADIFLAT